jgi:hypothetical protein
MNEEAKRTLYRRRTGSSNSRGSEDFTLKSGGASEVKKFKSNTKNIKHIYGYCLSCLTTVSVDGSFKRYARNYGEKNTFFPR